MQTTPTRVTDGRPQTELPAAETHRIAWRMTGVVFASATSLALAAASATAAVIAFSLFNDGGHLSGLWWWLAGISTWLGLASVSAGTAAHRKSRGGSALGPAVTTLLLCAPFAWLIGAVLL
jgi:hypothetical protein